MLREQIAIIEAAIAEMKLELDAPAPPAPGFFKKPLSPVGINFFDGAMAPSGPGSVNYKMPLADSMWAWWRGMGVNVARVAFKWERAQPTLDGPLDPAHLADMHATVVLARANDMSIIWNMHNYGSRHGSDALIGSNGLTNAHFAEVWQRIADQFEGNSAVAGYGLMNEPSGSMPDWPRSVQAAVNAIRLVDTETPIMVGGVGAGHAWEWSDRNGNLSFVVDPSNKLVFEAHQYSDQDSSGRFESSLEHAMNQPWVQALGNPMDFHAMLISNYIMWLNSNGHRGIIGETGIPSGMMLLGDKWWQHWDYRDEWVEALRRMISTAASAGVPTFIWTDGIHAEQNKLYVGHQAPTPGPVAAMLKQIVETYPVIA